MSLIDDLRREVNAAIDTLGRRFGSTTDEQEKSVILERIDALNGELSILNQAALLDAAGSLASVTVELEQAVAAARLGPFDGYLTAIEKHLARLNQLSGKLHARESLPAATARPTRGGAPKRPRRARAVPAAWNRTHGCRSTAPGSRTWRRNTRVTSTSAWCVRSYRPT